MLRNWFRFGKKKRRSRSAPQRRRFESLESRRLMAVFDVTTTADLGAGSLRDAILQANATPGADEIRFAIPSTGPQVILLDTQLPDITEEVLIDGYTQAGAAQNTLAVGDDRALMIELRGGDGSFEVDFGLSVTTGAGTTIRGLSLTNFKQAAIAIQADNVTVEGNYIGLSTDGTALGNSTGVLVSDGTNALIGGGTPAARNVISGNDQYGVRFDGSVSIQPTNGRVRGNYIGLNPAGDAAIGNGAGGVRIAGAASITVGGASGEGNVISGNLGAGIDIVGPDTADNRVFGNIIGLNAAGNAAIANSGHGISIVDSFANIIGSGGPLRNVISGNNFSGINIEQSEANLIEGNYIGLDATGSFAIGNAQYGVYILDGSENSIGSEPTTSNLDVFPSAGSMDLSAANVISGNGFSGIAISGSGSGNSIFGAIIGLSADGLTPTPNGDSGATVGDRSGISIVLSESNSIRSSLISGNAGSGVTIAATSDIRMYGNGIGIDANSGFAGNGSHGVAVYSTSLSTIGGPNQGNTIAGNNGAGIAIHESSPSNLISQNAIYGNAGLGIDLSASISVDGVTPNDTGDSDIGGNNLQNYPMITSVIVSATTLRVVGQLESAANQMYEIEFFGNGAADLSGNGEGRQYLGSTVVATDGAGVATFDVNLPRIAGLEVITATATDVQSLDTSEFSAAVGATLEPTLSINDVTLPEGNFGTVTFTFTVTLSEPQAWFVTVLYDTLDGTALAVEDYEEDSGILEFAPGETTATITVTVISDTLSETNEYFQVLLSNSDGATIGDGLGIGVILNDDYSGIAPLPRSSVFIAELYLDVLGRPADLVGLQYWSTVVAQGANRALVARSFLESAEYRSRMIDRFFDEFLDRAPTTFERADFLSWLAAGGRYEDLIATILGSAEYEANQAGLGRDFLEGLYQDLFGRASDAAGRQYWERALGNGITREQVARAFASSREFQVYLINDPADKFESVDRDWYRDYLGRPVDPFGLQYWMQALAMGATWTDLQAFILGSDEYFQRADGIAS